MMIYEIGTIIPQKLPNGVVINWEVIGIEDGFILIVKLKDKELNMDEVQPILQTHAAQETKEELNDLTNFNADIKLEEKGFTDDEIQIILKNMEEEDEVDEDEDEDDDADEETAYEDKDFDEYHGEASDFVDKPIDD